MTKKLAEHVYNSQLLFDGKWVQLRRIIMGELNINGYEYLHESRCNGNIIAILPYRIVDEDLEFLLRGEITPCWNVRNLIICSITGGVDRNNSIISTVKKELHEESGYLIYQDDDLISLNTCFGTKSSDTLYHLFSINLTDYDGSIDELTYENELEKSSYVKWVKTEDLINCNDPIVHIMYTRLIQKLFGGE